MHVKSDGFLQTSSSPEMERTACGFSRITVPPGPSTWLNALPEPSMWINALPGPNTWRNALHSMQFLTPPRILHARRHIPAQPSTPPQGLQITGRGAIGPSGHYHPTRSGSVTATKEIAADADPQATTSPRPLVLDSRTMSIVVPKKLGPKSEAEKSASKQLRQAGGACKKHRLGKKRVSPHCPPKIKNYVD